MYPPELTWADISAFRRGGELRDAPELEASLDHIRETFGERPMALPVTLLERLLNAAPWTEEWLCWLSAAMRRTETADGFQALRERLIDPDRHQEALSVLQVGDRLLAAGFAIAFEHPVLVEGKWKVPDIRVGIRASRFSAKSRCYSARKVKSIAPLISLPLS